MCNRRFYRREHLKKHHISKHGDEEYEAPASYRWPVRQKSFHYHGHFREHLKTHPAATSSLAAAPASPLLPPASGLRTDARTCPAELPASVPEDCHQCYRDNWSQIRSGQWGGKRILVHTQQLETGSDIGNMLRGIFRVQKNAFKINMAFGFILSNVETGEKRYYYPSQNGLIFDQPLVVADEADLQRVLQCVGETDWLEYVRQQKPKSKWHIALLTNVTFHLYPMEGRPIGHSKIAGQLPKWLVENRGLDALEKDQRTGKLYADHLCYFRCLARYRGCSLKNLKRKTQELASTYLATLEHPESFAGVRLRDLHALDNLFGMHTLVYALGEDGKVELVHRPTDILSKRESQVALRLNLYGGHSYVKHLTKYSRCFTCQRCNASFPKAHRLQRHERSCEARFSESTPAECITLPRPSSKRSKRKVSPFHPS